MATGTQLLFYGLPAAYALTSLVTAGLAGYLLTAHRSKPTARALAAVGGFLMVWAVGMGGRLLSSNLPSAIGWNTLAYVGITGTAVTWVLFALRYTGRDEYLTRPIAGLLALPGLVTVGLVATSGVHTLYYAAMRLVPRWGHLVFISEETALFYALAGWHYLLFVVGTALIVGFAINSHRIYRVQAAVLAVGTIGPLLVNLLYVTDLLDTGFDPTPFAFGVSVLLVAAAVLDAGFIDVLPVARSHVIDGLDEAIVVLDREDRIVDFNQPARPLLAGPGSIVGSPVTDRLPATVASSAVVAGTAPDGEPVEVAEGEGRWWRIRRQPLEAGGGQVGSLLVLSDVTDVKRREERLEANIRRLESFAQTVTHDLRNPLSVAVGRLDLAREEEDTEDLEAIDAALDRMDRIIDNMLTLAREGTTIDDPAPVDLTSLLAAAWAQVDTGEAELGTAVEVLPALLADGDRLLQVFENVFRNAVEHGASTVTVGALAEEPGIFVDDDGRGFEDGTEGRVFEEGFTTTDEGTGLGLKIVAEIAAAHGWDVRARPAPTGGARLEFTGLEFTESPPQASTTDEADRWPS